MRSNRKIFTLICLVISTLLGWTCVYFQNAFGPLALAPPIIFGMALVESNKIFLKSQLTPILVPLFFVLIFFGGSPAFYTIGRLINESKFTGNVFGSIGAFSLVILTIKINLKGIKLRIINCLFIIVLAVISVIVDAIITNKLTMKFEKNILWDRPDLTVLIYQLFMSIAIVSTMELDKSYNPRNI